jgi:hypothetical protein
VALWQIANETAFMGRQQHAATLLPAPRLLSNANPQNLLLALGIKHLLEYIVQFTTGKGACKNK